MKNKTKKDFWKRLTAEYAGQLASARYPQTDDGLDSDTLVDLIVEDAAKLAKAVVNHIWSNYDETDSDLTDKDE